MKDSDKDKSGTQVKIQYKFRDDKTWHTCHVTFEQYENLRILTIVKYCNIVTRKEDVKETKDWKADCTYKKKGSIFKYYFMIRILCV